MTTVGHILVGTAIGILSIPSSTPLREKLAYLCLFALLPNIPDLPFPHWGHDRYDISHSIFVNAFLMAVITYIFTRLNSLKGSLPKSILIGSCFTWLSHFLLDTFYSDGSGLAMFWPISSAHIHLPIPWFSVITTGMEFSDEVKQQFTAEFLSYFPFIMLAIGLRYIQGRNT